MTLKKKIPMKKKKIMKQKLFNKKMRILKNGSMLRLKIEISKTHIEN
jgi:hypothetical protein